tara:strand:+ start:308 stop:532 length:225 start_codon:yes stop_codon:yes gene_type:complete
MVVVEVKVQVVEVQEQEVPVAQVVEDTLMEVREEQETPLQDRQYHKVIQVVLDHQDRLKQLVVAVEQLLQVEML